MRKLFILLWFISSGIWAQSGKVRDTLQEQQLRFDIFFFDAMNERLKNNFEKSNEIFEQCLVLDDQNDAVYFKMAQNYFDAQNYSQAAVYLKKAQQLDPANKWYEKLRIEIKIKSGAPREEVLKMIEVFKPRAKNKYLIRNLYRQLQQPKVTFQTPKTHQKTPLTQIQNDLTAGQYNRVMEQAEKLLDEQPENARLYLLTAKAYTGLQRFNEALDYLDMGMDFVQNDKALQKAFYQQYIQLYEKLNKPEKVRQYRQKLAKL